VNGIVIAKLTPLLTRLTENTEVSTLSNSKCCNEKRQSSSVNLYIGQDFSFSIKEWFKFERLINNNRDHGLVHSNFDPFKKFKTMGLTPDSIKMLNEPNAGGSSMISEVLSCEMMVRFFNATLLKTEMEVSYWPRGGSITDYTCLVFGKKVGVSVSRAMKFRGQYEIEDGIKLLEKKLGGVIQSSKNTLENWSKQILHIWAMNKDIANVLTQAFDQIDENLKSNTLVLVTVSDNHREIFFNKP